MARGSGDITLENRQSKSRGEKFSWILSLGTHSFVAVAGAMAIGFVPEAKLGQAYYNTAADPYSPVIALVALLLGYFLSRHVRKGQAAEFVWVVGCAWMLFGIYATASGWNSTWSAERSRVAYVLANLFGSTLKCSGTECLGELFFTTPFTATMAYSIAAYAAKKLKRYP